MAKTISYLVQCTAADSDSSANPGFAELNVSGVSAVNAGTILLDLPGSTSNLNLFPLLPAGVQGVDVVMLFTYPDGEANKSCSVNADGDLDGFGSGAVPENAGRIWASRVDSSLTVTVNGSSTVGLTLFYAKE